MTKIRKGDRIIVIDCDNEMCGKCTYNQEPKCRLFDVMIDRVVAGYAKYSGCRRHSECINAEVK